MLRKLPGVLRIAFSNSCAKAILPVRLINTSVNKSKENKFALSGPHPVKFHLKIANREALEIQAFGLTATHDVRQRKRIPSKCNHHGSSSAPGTVVNQAPSAQSFDPPPTGASAILPLNCPQARGSFPRSKPAIAVLPRAQRTWSWRFQYGLSYRTAHSSHQKITPSNLGTEQPACDHEPAKPHCTSILPFAERPGKIVRQRFEEIGQGRTLRRAQEGVYRHSGN